MTDHPMLDAAERLKQLRDEKEALEEDVYPQITVSVRKANRK